MTERAFLVDRLIPHGKRAFRISVASVKHLSAFGHFLNQLAGAPGFRAGNAGFLGSSGRRHGLGILAIRIPAAGQKGAEFPLAHDHGLAAFPADLIGCRLRERFSRLDPAFFVAGVITGEFTFRISVAGQKICPNA